MIILHLIDTIIINFVLLYYSKRYIKRCRYLIFGGTMNSHQHRFPHHVVSRSQIQSQLVTLLKFMATFYTTRIIPLHQNGID